MNDSSSVNGRPTFAGRYVHDLRDTVLAAAASGVHAVLIGPPGCGKTAISKATMEAVYDPEEIVILRFNPTTPPSAVEGLDDPAGFMESPPVWRKELKGTAYDPDAKAILADEMSRANEATQDAWLLAMDRLEKNVEQPVIIGTVNFLPKSERSEALLDRFGLFLHVKSDATVMDVVDARLKGMASGLTIPGPVPTSEEIYEARHAEPTENSSNAVGTMIKKLMVAFEEVDTDEHISASDINNRRSTLWTNILFHVSTLYHGTNDFTEVHVNATRALMNSWKADNPEQSAAFAEIVQSVADPVGAAVDAILQHAYEIMREAIGDGRISDSEKVDVANKLTRETNKKVDEIIALCGDANDPRVRDAKAALGRALHEFLKRGGDD